MNGVQVRIEAGPRAGPPDGGLPMDEAAAHMLLVEWNATQVCYPSSVCLHELFQDQARRTADAIAVVGEASAEGPAAIGRPETDLPIPLHLSYGELDRRSNQLARYLLRQGVRPEAPVGLFLARSPQMVTALLGILKAGGAYLPLDPAYPSRQQSFALQESGARLLLTRQSLCRKAPALLGRTLCLDRERDSIAECSHLPLNSATASGNLAYIIYTSGSTGRPKGVEVGHRGVVRLAKGSGWVRLDQDERVLQISSIAFDAAAYEIWGSLLNGACLALMPPERVSLENLQKAVLRHQVTTLWLSAGLFRVVVENRLEALHGIRRLLAGGDVVSAPHVRKALQQLQGCRLINGYGPTENTVFTCCHGETDPARIDSSFPIGRPISNTQAYILDRSLRPTAVGEAGELVAGGDGVARGYLKRPALTAASFVPDPFSANPGSRLYRTGDLASWRPDGLIEFHGRSDQQVKVRGFRIEPGEVEAALAECPGVEQSLVVARPDPSGGKRLVAYVVPRSKACQAAPGPGDLRRDLLGRLPEYMIPSAFVLLDQIPLTPNGKVDLEALPEPEAACKSRSGAMAGSPFEELLAGIWAEVLGLQQVGSHEAFLDLGGHSLAAARIEARIRQDLGLELPLQALLENPTVASLAERLARPARRRLPPVERADREGLLPLTFPQERVWFLEQLTPGNLAYNFQLTLRFEGDLRPDILERAFGEIVRRHEILRTTFVSRRGQASQRIHPPWEVSVPLIDLSGLPAGRQRRESQNLVRRTIRRPFDITRLPLIRWSLLRLAPDDHLLIHSEHHMVHDGWSLARLLTEFQALYEAFSQGRPSPLPDLPAQFADLAAWERRWMTGEVLQNGLIFWTERLHGCPQQLDLPTDRPRRKTQGFEGSGLLFELPTELYSRLKALSRSQGATLFATMLAAFKALLYRTTLQKDLVVGSAMANRRLAEAEPQLGMLVNNVLLRTRLEGTIPFAELLRRVRRAALESYSYQDVPFDKLVEALQPQRDLSSNPLAQAFFSFHDSPMPDLRLPGVTASVGYCMNGTAKFDLNVVVVPQAEQRPGGGSGVGSGKITVLWEAAADLFDRSTVRRMTRHYRTLLEAVARDPQQRICDVPLLTAPERHQLLQEWNPVRLDGAGICAHQLFEQQARRRPDATALVEGLLQVSYGELDRRADRLARWARRLGVKAEVPAALCLQAGAAMATGLLGILKAGGAYLPLDSSLPPRRLAFMLEDSKSALLLAKPPLQVEASLPVIDPDRLPEPQPLEAEDLQPNPTPANLAYLIYTSGSTGRPKGVSVEHRGLVNLVRWHSRSYPMQAGRRASQLAGTGFDASVWEVWSALATGAALIFADAETRLSPARLVGWLQAAQIEVCFLPTPLAEAALLQNWPPGSALKALLTGGDRLHGSALKSLPAPLFNHYGPTENSVVATFCRVWPAAADPPIGRPIDNVEVRLLDPGFSPVPIGVPGELCIAGAGLARGYWRRPALTAQRFIPDPFSSTPGGRLYRSGDLVRYRPDGSIDFLGRIDHQVKVRGFRIETGEIEAVLCSHPNVREAAVVVQGEGERKSLAAYIVGSSQFAVRSREQKESGKGEGSRVESDKGKGKGRGKDCGLTTDNCELRTANCELIRSFLAERLPDYMVPSSFMVLERLPLTANGKLDRAALPIPEESAVAQSHADPRTPLEELVAEFWRQVLTLKRVDVHANFFELGGHSLLGARLLARIGEALSVDLPMRALFQSPTVAQLARRIEAIRRTDTGRASPPVLPRIGSGAQPLSFAQQRLWFMHHVDPQSAAYNFRRAVRLRGKLDLRALGSALAEIVQRHEALRTIFEESARGRPQQRVVPWAALELPIVDLSGLPQSPSPECLLQLVETFARRPFRLEQAPLLRALLLTLSACEHVLAVSVHHIAWDGWSAEVFYQELAILYEAVLENRSAHLAPLPVQYPDYALWQRQLLEGRRLQRLTQYWVGRLAGAPPQIDLPFDRPRPALQRFAGAMRRLQLPRGLSDRIRELGLEQGASPFMAFLAAFKVLLWCRSKQTDVVVGADVSNRTRSELEGLIGLFVNQLVLRTSLAGNPHFDELLKRVKETVLEAFAHQDLPFEKLVEALQPRRDLSRNPIFQVMFVFQNNPAPQLALPGLEASPLPLSVHSSAFDLSWFIEAGEEPTAVTARYDRALFDPSTIESMLQGYKRLLEAVAARPQSRLQELWALPQANKEQDMQTPSKKPSGPAKLDRLMKARPQSMAVSAQSLVSSRPFFEGRDLPLLIEPRMENVDAAGWAASQKDFIEEKLMRHGGILFRGFCIDSVERFEGFSRNAFGELIEYGERSSPRSQISGRIYTSTDHPADQPIVLHNEQSYTLNWPMKICFCCIVAAQRGGATPIASNRAVTRRISPQVAERLERRQVMYLRNYGEGLGLSWQTAFQTEDPEQVEAHCRRAAIEWEWREGGRLRTRQVRPAFRRHPRTGERLWFNHLVFFHVSSLEPSTRDSLLSSFAQDELPFNTFYGDGSPLEPEVLEELRGIYRDETFSFPWQKGDVLLLDNMLVSHGREPFEGKRQIATVMAEPWAEAKVLQGTS